tara:strand:- start:179 stop:373 length:195 start_codon:yes stop_codon:yes gene_type:complete
MKRLIDDKEATVARLHELYGRNPYGEGRFEKCIEELYAPNPVKPTNMSQVEVEEVLIGRGLKDE